MPADDYQRFCPTNTVAPKADSAADTSIKNPTSRSVKYGKCDDCATGNCGHPLGPPQDLLTGVHERSRGGHLKR